MDGINAFFWTLTYILWAVAASGVIAVMAGAFFAARGHKTLAREVQPTLTLKRSE